MKRNLPSPDLLRKLLSYDPETGLFHFRQRPRDLFSSDSSCRAWNARFAGKPSFYSEGDGYRIGRILSHRLWAHRVAFAIYHGRWPETEIDHINGDRADNRIANLREVTRGENARNRAITSRNKSGVLGVNWASRLAKWRASVGHKHVGYFDDFAEACRARQAAEELSGYHPNHGRMATA